MSNREFWADMPYEERMRAIAAFTWYHYTNPDIILWGLE